MAAPNLIQSLIIYKRFPVFPRNPYHDSIPSQLSMQKELISICYPGLKVGQREEYDWKTSAPLDKIQNHKQIHKVSRKFYDQSDKTIRSLRKEEREFLGIFYDAVLKNYRKQDKDELEERAAIIIEGNNLESEKIRTKLVETLILELKHTPRLEDYLQKK